MLDIEELLNDLRGLEHELNEIGVNAVLDERDDGMPEFHFGGFGGGLTYNGKGFRFTIWAGTFDDVYDTDLFQEFRHELVYRLVDQYGRKARFTREGWRELCGDNTPMPDNLVEKSDGYELTMKRLLKAIEGDEIPIFLDVSDFKLLRRHDPRDLLPEPDGERLRGMGLVERKYYIDQVFDEPTEEGQKAVEYTARVMGKSLVHWIEVER